MRKTRSLFERIMGRTVRIGECFVWTGGVTTVKGCSGYGLVGIHGRGSKVYVHRAIYEYAKGPIPEGLQIDHLCMNRRCVNPAHLEAVTQAENIRRGPHSTKTHCIRGHPLSGGNISQYRLKKYRQRTCLACQKQRNKEAWAQKAFTEVKL